MKHIYKTKVYYSDTDAYGVVWHGNYLRWMEMARTELCSDIGQSMKSIEESGYVIPVVGVNLRYKSSAKLHDKVLIETTVLEIKRFAMKFKQVIKNEETGAIYVNAEVDVVAVDKNTGKLVRNMPFTGFEKFIEE